MIEIYLGRLVITLKVCRLSPASCCCGLVGAGRDLRFCHLSPPSSLRVITVF